MIYMYIDVECMNTLERGNNLWEMFLFFSFEVCQHPHSGMRAWGAEAVTSLIRAALAHEFQPPLEQQQVHFEHTNTQCYG